MNRLSAYHIEGDNALYDPGSENGDGLEISFGIV